ncbi:MAG: hypothetical protein KDD48_05745 [Bdellovibrionales bacterium]|nr:hypothetical protein [Bdellovibrionales bacterium]
MKVAISTQDTRELNPIFIEINEFIGTPTAIVKSRDKPLSFALKLNQENKQYKGHFWLESKGQYILTVNDTSSEVSFPIVVHDQIFMSFTKEYGLFNLLFIPLFVGAFLWSKRILRRQHETQ